MFNHFFIVNNCFCKGRKIMQNISHWSKEEIQALFKFVEIKKHEGMPLIKIFDQYAAFTARHQNSVRNYYYKELAYLSQNPNFAKELEINLNNHQVTKATTFSADETNAIVNNIDNLKEEGYSVRKACLVLADNDAGKMIRLQNKYRSVKSSQTFMGEIIKMPQRQVIGDEEIKALFLGLV